MKVLRRRDQLRSVRMSKAAGSGQQSDGGGISTRLIRSNLVPSGLADGVQGLGNHWKSVTMVNLRGCALSVFPVELTKLPLLQKLFLNNKILLLPPELGELKSLKVLRVDNNNAYFATFFMITDRKQLLFCCIKA